MEPTNPDPRKYNSISPSAKVLLLMKGHTTIPFARQAAELMSYPGVFTPDLANNDFSFWARVAHFESRYRSIDQLLWGLPIKNILELSSGFSFRSLEAVAQNDIHYIDTDLPEIIEKKKEFVAALQKQMAAIKGRLELLPLNALDEKQFIETVNHFQHGELVIVNEGLLVYLSTEEKEKLCSIIRAVLKQRGGYWITADIYIKSRQLKSSLQFDDELERFLEQHQVEDNKFDSLQAAEDFFNRAGFVVDKEAEPNYAQLASVKEMMRTATVEQLTDLQNTGKIHTTWRLKLAGG